VKLCTSVASAGRELRFRPLEAEAFLLLGRLLDRSGDYAAAEQALLEATWAPNRRSFWTWRRRR